MVLQPPRKALEKQERGLMRALASESLHEIFLNSHAGRLLKESCTQPVSQGLTSATPPKHRLRRDPVPVWSRDIPDFGI
jgi:hypothetical protein